MGKILLIFVCLYLLIPTSHAELLDAKMLKDLRGSISASCFISQRAAPVNSIASDEQIRFYCTCFAYQLVTKKTTVKDLKNAALAIERAGGEAGVEVLLNGRALYLLVNGCVAQIPK